MSTRSTALAIARAMLTTPVSRFGMLERMPMCTRFSAGANVELVDIMLGKGLTSQWMVERLADELEDEATFHIACDMAKRSPLIHGWFMTRATTLAEPPAPLRAVDRPPWPSIGRLAEDLGVSLPGLWRLTRSGSWQRQAPLSRQHYRYELLPKRIGGWRLLEVPEPYLRALQRRVLDALLAHVPPHEAACGYVRGRSVVDHARAHAGQVVLLKFDLQDFFATVRASRVHATFVELGARYTRYADDIVLSGDASLRRSADRIEARIGGFALDEGFALNHRETRRVSRGRRQQVCNIVVNERPNLPRDEFGRLKAQLHRCATLGPATQNREGLPHWEQHLRGRVAWAAQLNPQKAQRLQRLLDRIDWSA